jgi:hypothetical protein
LIPLPWRVSSITRRRIARASGLSHSASPMTRAISRPWRSRIRVEELRHPLDPAPVGGKRDHGEIIARHFTRQPVDRGHLGPAGRAPGRPDVQQHHLAGIIGQGDRVAVEVAEGLGDAVAGFVVNDQLGHVAGAQLLEGVAVRRAQVTGSQFGGADCVCSQRDCAV